MDNGNFVLLGMVFICNFSAVGGRAAFPREGGGGYYRGGYYRDVDEMGSWEPGVNQTEEQLRIPTGCSQSLLLSCLLGLVLVVLVKGWFYGGMEVKKVFFSFFSRISQKFQAHAHRSCSNLYSPRVQRGKEMDSTKYHSKEGPSVIVTVHNLSQPFHWITVNPALLLVTSYGRTQWNINSSPAVVL